MAVLSERAGAHGLMHRWWLVAWSFPHVGILLGGWWSSEVLGWGGCWAWAPVEPDEPFTVNHPGMRYR